ncbi:cob(I)yrinic acid a,c-diamide adenosyltransferase [Candidatus Berkelbacteria bacterium]|nr:cob(I)yrinic acid a,c-diamide adenosyltransferase [Candidatus Berkelbacteria bacterium]
MSGMTRLYTRTGDAGTTGLLGGERASKADLRFEAIGTLDELNAQLGIVTALLRTQQSSEPPRSHGSIVRLVESVQADLFTIGAALAEPTPSAESAIPAARILELEAAIDQSGAQAPRLVAFILPGGTAAAAHCHVARTVCRRAERALVTLARELPISPTLLTYVNRLSDLLFAISRSLNAAAEVPEPTWSGSGGTSAHH